MEIRSNILSHYFYITVFSVILLSFTILLYLSISSAKLDILWLILGLICEFLLIFSYLWILKYFARVEATKDYIRISGKDKIFWKDVNEATEIFKGDFYFLKFEDNRYLIFVGDRLPLGALGVLMQESKMHHLINSVKRRFNI